MSDLKSVALKVVGSVKSIVSKFFKDSCLVRASGLAYSTLLAVVPFITIVYAFGGFDTLGKSIESALLQAIMPTHQEALLETINSFTRNSITTGTVGMIFFLVTSLFLINTIARNFDSIWGIEATSGMLRRYAAYTAILVFGSLLLGASTTITEFFEKLILTNGVEEVEEYRIWFTKLLPYLITFSILFLMMVIIPSNRVRPGAALIGALVAWILFEAAKILFKFWVVNSVRNSLIYGSLSIIPIFLVGLYLFWIIVLIGVEVTYFIQHEKDFKGLAPGNLSMEERIALAVELFTYIGSNYREGKSVTNRSELEKRFMISPRVIDFILSKLLDAGLLIEFKEGRGGVTPGKSMDCIFVKDIVFSLYGVGSRLDSSFGSHSGKDFINGGCNSLERRSILEIISEVKDEE